MKTAAELPDWPRLLSREQLCAYLGGIGEVTVLRVCPVAPVDLGANVLRYSRAQIDAWVETLPPRLPKAKREAHGDTGDGQAALDEPPPDNSATAALDRVRQRALNGGGGCRGRKKAA